MEEKMVVRFDSLGSLLINTVKVARYFYQLAFKIEMAASGSRLRLTVILQMGVFCMAILWASSAAAAGQSRKLAALVEEPSVVLTYHDGPLLSGSGVIPVHLIWYGQFTPVQRSIVADFVQSLGGAKTSEGNQPSASTWWKTTHKYQGTHSNKAAPASTSTSSVVMLGKQKMDQHYSLGKSLKRTDIAALVEAAVKSGTLPPPRKSAGNGNGNAVYLVLTSEDVTVEGFCMSSCGFHANLNLNLDVVSSAGSQMMQGKPIPIPYAWVGNSASQCPGQCAWPFHQPMYGPQTPPLVAPNGDVGIDGIIINMATVLAGAATNPFNTGYFQGDAAAPLEAVSACAGIYGKGAYPSFPGELLMDKTTGASYNAQGVNGRAFLLPAMWDPATKSCQPLV